MIAEKIARGCEFQLKGRYVEPPYGISVAIQEAEMVFPANVQPLVQIVDLGPGCRIKRMSEPGEPNLVRYWITVWGALHLFVAIDKLAYFQELEKAHPRTKEGLDLSNRPAMRINPYLREYKG